MLKTEPFGTSTAKIVYSKNEQSILGLPTQEVLEMFESFGALLFRGFGVTYKEMREFSAKFSSKFVRDTSRQTIDDFVQLVNNGTDEVLPHSENSGSPFQPDLVWFCCGVPAAQDGETILLDGVKVWQQLDKSVKQLFLSQRIKYEYNFEAKHWKLFFGSETTIADVKQTLNNIKDVNYQIKEDESICFKYTCPAVVKTKFGARYAFANSIISYYQEPLLSEKPEVSDEVNFDKTDFKPKTKGDRGIVYFEDGSPIPKATIDAIKGVMAQLTDKILWQTGDLIMIDNSRFLHGRRAFQDEQRLIYTHLSYLK